MPAPSIPNVTPFTLARATDINAISAALAALSAFNASGVPTLPVDVTHMVITGQGGIPDLQATPSSTINIPLTFGFVGTLLNGEEEGVFNIGGVGACKVGPYTVYAKCLDATTGLLGFFTDGTLTTPLVVDKNVVIWVIVHSVLGELPPDAWLRQLDNDAFAITNSALNKRLASIEDATLGAIRPANTYYVSPLNGDFTTLSACLTAIGVAASPTSILVWPGTYTETPATVSGNIEIVGMGPVQLNYASGSAGLTIPNDGANHTLRYINITNSSGPALAINGGVSSVYCAFSGTVGISMNAAGPVELDFAYIQGTTGPALSVVSSFYTAIGSSYLTASGAHVLDLTSSGASLQVKNITLDHQGFSGLNIAASAPASIIGGPLVYQDTTVGISPDVTLGSGATALATPHKEQVFATTSSVTVIHNMGYRPIVQIIDGGDSLVIPQNIVHNSKLDFTVTFYAPTSGTVIYS